MTFRLRTLLTLFFIGIFAYVLTSGLSMPIQAKLFPVTVSGIALVLLLWTLFRELRPSAAESDGESGADMAFTVDEGSRAGVVKALELFAWLYGFAACLWLIGFLVSIPLMILLYLLRHRESPALVVILPSVTGFVTWGLFDRLLHLPLPEGVVFEWLGWL